MTRVVATITSSCRVCGKEDTRSLEVYRTMHMEDGEMIWTPTDYYLIRCTCGGDWLISEYAAKRKARA